MYLTFYHILNHLPKNAFRRTVVLWRAYRNPSPSPHYLVARLPEARSAA